MERNVGKRDRELRYLAAAVLGFLAANALIDSCVPDWYAPVFGTLSLVFLLNAYTRKCGILRLLGTDTCTQK